MAPKKTYTTGEVAQFCGVNFRTVIRWIEKGHLKAYQLPGRGDNRIEAEDLKAFMQAFQMPLPAELEQVEEGIPDDAVNNTGQTVLNSNLVLIVDDDKLSARAIERVLRKAGYQTLTAHDGFSAGTLLTANQPALMSLDLNMPGLNGFEVIDHVRGELGLHDLKILVISGGDEADLRRSVQLGANAYLTKPFENETLVQTIHGLLNC